MNEHEKQIGRMGRTDLIEELGRLGKELEKAIQLAGRHEERDAQLTEEVTRLRLENEGLREAARRMAAERVDTIDKRLATVRLGHELLWQELEALKSNHAQALANLTATQEQCTKLLDVARLRLRLMRELLPIVQNWLEPTLGDRWRAALEEYPATEDTIARNHFVAMVNALETCVEHMKDAGHGEQDAFDRAMLVQCGRVAGLGRRIAEDSGWTDVDLDAPIRIPIELDPAT